MNILYCGDSNVGDGLLISILSLLKNTKEELHIWVFTMTASVGERSFSPVPDGQIAYLNAMIKERNENNFVKKVDLTERFLQEPPEANLQTRFTPYCMLRLFADGVKDLPGRVLYLDTDVLCRRDIGEYYRTDLSGYDLAGTLDYYGKWFFRNNLFHMDYMNSGVLLLNLDKIREDGLFARCRKMCRTKQMFMPDQSALNKLAVKKKMPRKYNEQRKLQKDTVIQHFTTSFRFFPWLHTLTVKPWQVERVHSELKLHEYDDILEQYQRICPDFRRYGYQNG